MRCRTAAGRFTRCRVSRSAGALGSTQRVHREELGYALVMLHAAIRRGRDAVRVTDAVPALSTLVAAKVAVMHEAHGAGRWADSAEPLRKASEVQSVLETRIVAALAACGR